jgi:hypothetical protein
VRGGGPASFSGDTRAGPPPSTHQEREALWTGITPRDKLVHGFLIPCAPPRPRLAAGRACPPHHFRPSASRTPTTRAQGQGLTPPQNQQRGRHRRKRLRAWLRWWWLGPPPVPITEETRKALRYWLARERGYLPQPYIPQPRHIVVLPRQHSAPDADAPVTGPNAVPNQATTPPRARAHNVG